MSDSDDEGAFESADEGEGTPQHRARKQSKGKDTEAKSTDSKVQSDGPSTGSPDTKADVPDVKDDHTTEKEELPDVKDLTVSETNSAAAGSDSPVLSSAPVITQSPHSENIERGTSEEEEKKLDVLEKLSSSAKEQKPGWGWGGISSWGTSVLSTATTGVSTLTHSVGEGFTQVLETVESSLGAPTPEEAAEMEETEKKEKEELEAKAAADVKEKPESGEADSAEPETQEEAAGGWASNWAWGGISGITSVLKETVQTTAHVVQSTTDVVAQKSQKIVSGSLDVLESIGKKTYGVIAEGDHGLKSTMQASDRPNLTKLLRQAKEDADHRSKQEEEFIEARKSHFGAQFDDFQGLAHLEALEMLSNQCEGKVQTMLSPYSGAKLDTVKGELITIKGSFELEEMDDEDDEDKDHDFDRIMADYVGQLGLNTSPEKIINGQEKARKWLMDCQTDHEDNIGKSPKEIHESAIQTLAELTANTVGLFHKVGQLLLAEKAPLSSYKSKASALENVTKTMCTEIGILSGKFTQLLNSAADKSETPDEVNPLITNVYLEATNSSTYVQDAFQLVLPVMQQSAIEAFSNQDQDA